MSVIESEDAAARLARVIVSDIELYNREKFRAGADLTDAIREGRALFRSRVAPALLPIFETVLADKRSAAAAAPVRAPAASAPAVIAPAAVVSAPAPIVAAAAVVSAPAPIVAAPASIAPASIASTPAPVVSTPAPAPMPAVSAPAPAAAPPAAAAPVVAPSSRPGLIEAEDAAARFARVIVSDIQLYNQKKIAAGANLSYEIEEGRSLFRSRVAPELMALFDTALAGKGLGDRRRSAPAASAPATAAPVAAAPISVAATPVAPKPAATPPPVRLRAEPATPPPLPIRAEAPEAPVRPRVPTPPPVRAEPAAPPPPKTPAPVPHDDNEDMETPVPAIIAAAVTARAEITPAPLAARTDDLSSARHYDAEEEDREDGEDGEEEQTPAPMAVPPTATTKTTFPIGEAVTRQIATGDVDEDLDEEDRETPVPVMAELEAPAFSEPAPVTVKVDAPQFDEPAPEPAPVVAPPPVAAPRLTGRVIDAPVPAPAALVAPAALASPATAEISLRPKRSPARIAITVVLLAAAGVAAYFLGR